MFTLLSLNSESDKSGNEQWFQPSLECMPFFVVFYLFLCFYFPKNRSQRKKVYVLLKINK